MYEEHPEFYVNSASINFLDRKGDFGNFTSERVTIFLTDEMQDTREDVFALPTARFDDLLAAPGALILVSTGDLDLQGRKAGTINGGFANVHLEGTWELSGEKLTADFRAQIRSPGVGVLVPQLTEERLRIRDATLTMLIK